MRDGSVVWFDVERSRQGEEETDSELIRNCFSLEFTAVTVEHRVVVVSYVSTRLLLVGEKEQCDKGELRRKVSLSVLKNDHTGPWTTGK
jgi:hypothetical protein